MPLDAGPEQPGKQVLVFCKFRTAPFLHHVDEGLMDFELQ